MPTKPPMILVKRRALIGRVARALAKQDRELHADRSSNQVSLYITDAKKQTVVETDVDIEALARRIGVMKPWERLAE